MRLHALFGCATAGFSKIEVRIVMFIIAILAAIAISMFVGRRDRAKDADADDPWPTTCDQSTVGPYLMPDQWSDNPFDDGTQMHTPTARSAGTYLHTRDISATEPRPYRLTVFLKNQADLVTP